MAGSAGSASAGPASAAPDAAETGTAGGREHLTRARVVGAALAIVDRDGLDGLTMRALGRELGVDPMAAYHWFPNKFAILQGVSEAILSEISAEGVEDAPDWIAVGRAMATEYMAAILRHPNALPVSSTQPVLTPRGMELVERIAAQLVRHGWTAVGALEAINMIAAFVIGVCVVEIGVTPGSEPITSEKALEVYQAISPAQFPTLAAAIAGMMANRMSDDAAHDLIIEISLRGMDVVCRQRGMLK